MSKDIIKKVYFVGSAGSRQCSAVKRLPWFAQLRYVLISVIILVLMAIGTALASPEDTYSAGRRAWAAGDYKQAFELFLKCAKAGHGGCMQSVSTHYLNGRGVERDYAAAMAWAQKAYATGTQFGLAGAFAARDIGVMFRRGQGVPRNVDEGIKWLERASSLLASLEGDHRYTGDMLRKARAYNLFQLTLSWTLRGDQEKAKESAEQALFLHPGVAWYHCAHGMILDRLGDYSAALAEYGEAIRLDPKDYRFYSLRSVNSFLRGRFSEAIDDISAWTARRSDDLFAPLLHYVARLKTGVPEAEAAKALVPLSGRSEWPGAVIDLLIGRVTVDAALAAARSAEPPVVRGREVEVYFYLGEQLLARGDAVGAGELLRKAVAADAFDNQEYWMAKAELARLGLK